MMSDIDDLEGAVYSLERTVEKNLRRVMEAQSEMMHILNNLHHSIVELQRLNNIDNEDPSADAPEMLKQTYQKHQFAKGLVLGEQNDRK